MAQGPEGGYGRPLGRHLPETLRPFSSPALRIARRSLRASAAILTATACAGEPRALERQLIEMPADRWLEAPDTKLADVCAPKSFGVDGDLGCAGIIEAWGSGAYAGDQRKMFVWGGGHNDYWGNELYAFDLPSGRWERITDPSPGEVVKAGTDPLPDGKPNSRHTYDGIQYIEHGGKLFGQGGAVSPGGGGTSVTWLFDPGTRSWRDAGNKGRPGGYGIASGYDPKSRAVFVRATKALWRYDADSETWTRLKSFGTRPLWPRYEVSGNKRGAVDTRRGRFWVVGNNDFLVWDIAHGKIVTDEWVTTGGGKYTNEPRVRKYPEQVFRSGGGDIYNAPAPGFDYDSKADQFVAWRGGAPYVLDLATKTWSRRSGGGAPAAQARNGTYGRWRYLREYNVFMLVNSATSNVFFYKNTAGGRAAPQ